MRMTQVRFRGGGDGGEIVPFDVPKHLEDYNQYSGRYR